MTRGSDSANFSLGEFLPLMNKKNKSNATYTKGLLPKKEHKSCQILSFSFNRHIYTTGASRSAKCSKCINFFYFPL
jgi:hypothetical protein